MHDTYKGNGMIIVYVGDEAYSRKDICEIVSTKKYIQPLKHIPCEFYA